MTPPIDDEEVSHQAFVDEQREHRLRTVTDIVAKAGIAGVSAYYTSGIPAVGVAFVAALTALIVSPIDVRNASETSSRLLDLDVRIRDLERVMNSSPGYDQRRISGDRAKVLSAAVILTHERAWPRPKAEELAHISSLSAKAYDNAALELSELGLVRPDMNAGGTYIHHRLEVMPASFVQMLPKLIPGVRLAEEAYRMLEIIGRADSIGHQVEAMSLVRDAEVSIPHVEVLTQLLSDHRMLERVYMVASAEGPFFGAARITTGGRRVLRGDDPLPFR